MTSTSASWKASDTPQVSGGHTAQIAQWSVAHSLSLDEIARLNSVLVDYAPDEIAAELSEELRCILAARKLATMPELTAAVIERARFAIESGKAPFFPQDVD